MKQIAVAITTSAGGAAEVYTPSISARLSAIFVDVGTLAATTDITITEESTGASLLTLTNVAADARHLVRVQASDTSGAPITGAYDSPVVRGRIKTVVAQGGNAASGTVYFYVDAIGSESEISAFAERTFTGGPADLPYHSNTGGL